MKKLNEGSQLFLILFFSVLLLGEKKIISDKSNKYPVVVEVSGPVFISGRDDQRIPAQKGSILVERARIETEAKSKIIINLDEVRRVHIEENSIVEIPSISWETGEAAYFDLKQGVFRWSQESRQKESYPIFLRSSLFHFKAVPGNYVVFLKPEIPLTSIKVLSGQMEFGALNSDETVMVKENEKVEFKGIIESGEIVYDILLKGKKIPRGSLSKVEKLTNEEKDRYSLEREQKEREAEARRIRWVKAQKKKMEEGQICIHPSARFNECAWICEGNPKNEKKTCRLDLEGVRCIRKRCDGNGQWSDPTSLKASEGSKICKGILIIRPCDY